MKNRPRESAKTLGAAIPARPVESGKVNLRIAETVPCPSFHVSPGGVWAGRPMATAAIGTIRPQLGIFPKPCKRF
jgi:hypothetical protein